MIKEFARLFGLVAVSCALGCSGSVDGSEESVGGNGGSNAAGASGQAGQGGQSTGGQGGSSGSSGNAGSAGVSGQAGSSGSSGSGGSGGAAGSSGASGTGGVGGSSGEAGSAGDAGQAGNSGQAGSSGTGGVAGEAGSAGAAGSENDGGTDAVTGSVLTLGLMADPPSTIYVKRMQNVPALGFMASAAGHDILVNGLDLECRGSINGGPFQATDCQKLVTSVAVYRGADQVGLAWAPNTDGSLHFSPQLVVPGGSSIALTVKMSISSNISPDWPYDRVAFGIKQVSSAIDLITQQAPQIILAPEVSTAQLSNAPIVSQTIRPSGTLKIEADGHPAAQIVIGGKDSWFVAASYKAMAQYEAATIDRSSVIQDSELLADNADVVAVAVASAGIIHGQTVLPASPTGCNDADMSGSPIQVPKDGSTSIQVWVKYAAPLPGAAVNGAQHGVPRSGHQPRVGLSDSIMGGEWPTEYLNRFNLRSTGETSGERLYASSVGVAKPNVMVLRKSRPIFSKLQTPFGNLGVGSQDLYRFQVAADGILDQAQNIVPNVAIKQYAFDIKFEGCDPVLSNARLYRSAMEIAASDYSLVDGYTGSDLKFESLTMLSGSVYRLIAAFTNEEIVSGSGYQYELLANLQSVTLGCSMTTKLAQDPNPVVKTGYLLQNDAYAPYAASYGIFNVGMWPDQNGLGAWHVQGTQVWSDQSELPHIALTLPSSADWTTDPLVNDLTSTLVKVSTW